MQDLGIHFEHDLSFKINHKLILNKSHKMLGFINRIIKKFTNLFCLKTPYRYLVRS